MHEKSYNNMCLVLYIYWLDNITFTNSTQTLMPTNTHMETVKDIKGFPVLFPQWCEQLSRSPIVAIAWRIANTSEYFRETLIYASIDWHRDRVSWMLKWLWTHWAHPPAAPNCYFDGINVICHRPAIFESYSTSKCVQVPIPLFSQAHEDCRLPTPYSWSPGTCLLLLQLLLVLWLS